MVLNKRQNSFKHLLTLDIKFYQVFYFVPIFFSKVYFLLQSIHFSLIWIMFYEEII